MLFHLVALFAAAGPALAQNVASPQLLVGTWASGSKNVVTGPGFATPANTSFTYPPTTGVSYSFTTDGYYEIARYRFTSNATKPKCITGVMNWVHGQYVVNDNSSITLTPFGDGYQQIQDPCAPVTNFVENYNNTELISLYQIFQDITDGDKLHLFAFDGQPLPPQFRVSATPNMLPTEKLRNVTAPPAADGSSGGSSTMTKRNAADGRWSQLNGHLLLAGIVSSFVGGIVVPLIL